MSNGDNNCVLSATPMQSSTREVVRLQRVNINKHVSGQIACSLIAQVCQKKERWNLSDICLLSPKVPPKQMLNRPFSRSHVSTVWR